MHKKYFERQGFLINMISFIQIRLNPVVNRIGHLPVVFIPCVHCLQFLVNDIFVESISRVQQKILSNAYEYGKLFEKTEDLSIIDL